MPQTHTWQIMIIARELRITWAARRSQAMNHGVRTCSRSAAWTCMELTKLMPSTSTLMRLAQHGGQRARRKTGNGAPTAALQRRRQSTTSRRPKNTLIASRPPRHFILALAYTAANWNEDTGGERTDEKVFEAVKTVFEAVPGKRVSSLVPDLSCWFDQMVEGGMEEQRSKHFTLFFNAKWTLEVRFIVEKRRQVESLLERAAEVVVRRLESLLERAAE